MDARVLVPGREAAREEAAEERVGGPTIRQYVVVYCRGYECGQARRPGGARERGAASGGHAALRRGGGTPRRAPLASSLAAVSRARPSTPTCWRPGCARASPRSCSRSTASGRSRRWSTGPRAAASWRASTSSASATPAAPSSRPTISGSRWTRGLCPHGRRADCSRNRAAAPLSLAPVPTPTWRGAFFVRVASRDSPPHPCAGTVTSPGTCDFLHFLDEGHIVSRLGYKVLNSIRYLSVAGRGMPATNG